ncbi:peptide-methionine (S)-S-oxide reductase MsrA [Marichromatium bheemlicum]|uniref:Peptide methionine sulfoxide reductase MsrA n=1 Tax=Marichromatium bheemlicum TaxID=365339 RepID=A0ABX1I6M9_9GAMM|nr:peptide-methionine (S)-S-oxide reductase MsrA [Marichromatium bheemlicum]NKN33137.1 peptide-methionine (S)-S-oxide reductase MsrA [Marichromatium bheemlicum]
MQHALATLGGGCFWCLEAGFERLRGVETVVSGYAGGGLEQPGYRDVCRGDTGHAEVVQVRFDPTVIDYASLLKVFFTLHDPTTRNRQGADIGTQYRSVIFHHNAVQREQAAAMIARLDAAGLWPDPIVTELLPVPTFYAAEPEHQGYFRRHPRQPYCQAVIDPKLAKLRQRHRALLA